MTAGDSVELSSPNYPLFYPDNARCTWWLHSNAPGSYVIHFLHFDTEVDQDWLIVARDSAGHGVPPENNVIYQVSSFVPSHVVVVIEESYIWILFQSDHGVKGKGFQLQVERIDTIGKYDTNLKCGFQRLIMYILINISMLLLD